MPATDAVNGLSAAEARARLEREGANELPAPRRASLPALVLDVAREPMFALLIAAALLYLAIGDPAEASLLLLFATLSVSIAIVQRGRSERALEALREVASPRALVLRDGERVRIPGREVVRGDVVVLAEGDRIPADGFVIAGDHIAVDESLLTGESVAVRKEAARSIPDAMPAPIEASGPAVFGGTLVVGGSGLAVILATGTTSAIGRIGHSLAQLSRAQPRLEREMRRLVTTFSIFALVLCGIATLSYGLRHDAWVPALLGGIALGMALLPEEFPLVLTVYMAMGAWRLSRSRVLTRRAAAIETLGAATVLCTDKTGTLTRNLMTVEHLECDGARWTRAAGPAPVAGDGDALATLLETALLASDAQRTDPMDRAIGALAEPVGASVHAGRRLLREYPLRHDLLAVTRVWFIDGHAASRVAAKGAPEAIIRLCKLGPEHAAAIHARVDELAARGVRVLAAARAVTTAPADALPATAGEFAFDYAGLIGFTDPLRESVPDAVRECHEAGIRVVMITGDYPATARAIAAQAGIPATHVLSGAELERTDDAGLSAQVRDVAVFARISPAQKLRIVEAFKRNGEVVAMTGDGVNDAPALKRADIGIAMGGRGTDVAREAASIVLLDDDFGSVVRAVRVGRRIYDNLRKATGFILAVHVPIAALALLPVLFGGPLLLTPLLIALLELIIDPACSIVLEAEREERDVMRRPPRAPTARLVSWPLFVWALLQGGAALVTVCVPVLLAERAGLAEPAQRTVAFLSLAAVNVALVFVNRTFATSLRSALGLTNGTLWWGVAAVAAVVALVAGWPAARGYFGMAALPAAWLSALVGASLALFAGLELVKLAWRRRLVT